MPDIARAYRADHDKYEVSYTTAQSTRVLTDIWRDLAAFNTLASERVEELRFMTRTEYEMYHPKYRTVSHPILDRMRHLYDNMVDLSNLMIIVRRRGEMHRILGCVASLADWTIRLRSDLAALTMY